jgi:endogenous inhibitor of DNA gyrase (YacG/DUF329 family)
MLTDAQKYYKKIKKLYAKDLCFCKQPRKPKVNGKLYSLCEMHYQKTVVLAEIKKTEIKKAKMMTKSCQSCGIKFDTTRSNKIYCSKQCSVIASRKTLTEKQEIIEVLEQKIEEKIEEKIKQNTLNCDWKLIVATNKKQSFGQIIELVTQKTKALNIHIKNKDITNAILKAKNYR